MKKRKHFVFLSLLGVATLLGILGMVNYSSSFILEKKNRLIHGFNLVAPRAQFSIDSLKNIQKLGANWIAVVPYAFCDPENAKVIYGNGRQWWGETPEGIQATIQMAHALGLNVMLKPHLWVRGQGWAGDLDFDDEKLWKHWESQYAAYLDTYTKIAIKEGVAVYCIGTEIRQSTKKRALFWNSMINNIRNEYKGSLTYAANWDEFENVNFWDKLDYIGVDAYFPLSSDKTPTIENLKVGWEKPKSQLAYISNKFNKPVLFTEYGYESVDYPTIGHWNVSKDTLSINFEAQSNSFEALFLSLKNEHWWAGGFIWKWHLDRSGDHMRTIKAYTPQDKPALKTIQTYFN